MSLVRSLDEIRSNVRTLECPRCGERFDPNDLTDPLTCTACEAVGLIPRRDRVGDRYPGAIGKRFTPMPEALMDHAEALGLTGHDLLIVWALERHRRRAGERVFPSIPRLAALTRLSERTVKRTIARLADAGLVARHRTRWRETGALTSNRYDLDPLWAAVAHLDSGREATAARSRRPDCHDGEATVASERDVHDI